MTSYARNALNKAKILLTKFPALVILGARQCGKTTLSRQIAPGFRYLDLENNDHLAEIMRDPQFFFTMHASGVIIDEAQSYPEIFRVLRGVIDARRGEMGRFILTGSSSPELLQNAAESLAGRVAIMELGTLKANEEAHLPLSEFYGLFQEKLTAAFLNTLPPPGLDLPMMQKAWLYGGYPEPLLKDNPEDWALWMEFYRDTYINRDIAALFPKLNRLAYQRFLNVLSQVSGTILNKSELGRDIEISEKAVREYLSIAEGTFLWRQLPSFETHKIKSVIKMPKGHIRDSGLLNYLLRYRTFADIQNSPYLGRLFEGFIIEEILKGFAGTMQTGVEAFYYRTRGGAEIDLILQGPFGLLPIEIKVGAKVDPRQLKNLHDFITMEGCPFGLLINQSSETKWLTPFVFQLPCTYL